VTLRSPPLVGEITSLPAAEAIEGEWTDLWRRAGALTTFQRPDWVLAWMRHFPLHEPWIVVARRDGRLAGLAPLFVYRSGADRVVAPIGAGITDYLDVLVERDDAETLRALLCWIDSSGRPWDVLDLIDLPRRSTLLRAALPGGWVDRLTLNDDCPVLSLPSVVEHLERVVPARQLARLARARRRATRDGQVSVEVATPESLDELLDAILRLHGARWSERGSDGVLADEAVQRFHRDVAPALLCRGVLRLYGLRLDGQIIASLYAFFEAREGYCYLQGFDPAFGDLSPGLLLLGAVIEDAVRRGLATLDFLRGREAYKYAWGARDEPTFRRRIVRT
jgi:CelD/BcsL family acetyltransferase involved in cellulose biosynthesis